MGRQKDVSAGQAEPATAVVESRRLATLHALGALDTPPSPAIDRVVDLARNACSVPIGLVTLVDETRQWFKSVRGLEGVTETPRHIAFCDTAIQSDNVLVVEDATLDERFADNPLVTGELDVRFYAGAPLIAPNGSRLGALCLLDREPRQISAAQSSMLTQLAGTVVDLLMATPTDGLDRLIEAIDELPEPFLYAEASSGRIIYANRAATADLHQSKGELSTQTLDELFPEFAWAEVVPALDQGPFALEFGTSMEAPGGWRRLTLERVTQGPNGLLRVAAERRKHERNARRKTQTKEAAILAAAKKVLVREGSSGFSVRKVAKEANVGLGHIQHFYPSKSDLLHAMVDSIAQSFWQHYENHIAPLANPQDRFVACAEFVLDAGPDPDMVPLLRTFWAMAPLDPAIAQSLADFYTACRRLAARILKDVNPALDARAAKFRAAEVVSLISGAFVYTESWGEQGALTDYREYVLARALALTREPVDY